MALLEMLMVRGLSDCPRIDCMHGGYHRLFNRNRVGCRKSIPKGLIERLFVPFALALAADQLSRRISCFGSAIISISSTTSRKFQALMEIDRAYVLGNKVESIVHIANKCRRRRREFQANGEL